MASRFQRGAGKAGAFGAQLRSGANGHFDVDIAGGGTGDELGELLALQAWLEQNRKSAVRKEKKEAAVSAVDITTERAASSPEEPRAQEERR